MAHLAERLVGRAEQLRSLERILDELEQGRPEAIELAGEPGIGKTRLLREVGARAEGRGHLVLSGTAAELERDLPFSVFVDAIDQYVAGLEPSRLAVHDETQAELAHLLPSLSAMAVGREVALQQERYRSHRAVRMLLEGLAQERPLILILDDFHWADSGSVELLGSLLRHPPAAAVLMVVGLRPRQVPERLAAALERARRSGSLTRIELGPLAPDEARELLGASQEDATATVLYQESGGNPLYLEQLARSLDRSGRAGTPADQTLSGMEIPAAVAVSFSEELALLSAPSRRVLEGAAVAGDPFEPDLAADAAETSEAAALDAVDELLKHDLIRQTDVPRRFRFRHPLVRRVVYETARAGWRLGAHERCARVLAAQGATATAQAHHVERYARRGDLAAVALLRSAGDAAARLAPASAAHWFGSALRLLPDTAPSEERLSLLLARAGSLAATGQFAESHVDLLAGVDVAVRDAPQWRIRAVTACAAIEQLLGLQTEAHRHLASAYSDLGEAPSADAVALMIELSVDAFHAGDREGMLSWAERSAGTAAPLGEPALLAAAVAVHAWASAVAGTGERAQKRCDEATKLIDELSDEVLVRRLDALANLASADLFLDRFAAAAHHAQRALEIGRATGHGDVLPLLVAMLGGSLWVQGKPKEAGLLFDAAVEAARLAGNVQSLAWMLFNRSIAALVAGDLEVALSMAEESVELEASLEPGLLSATAAAVLASALFEAGQVERSVEVIRTKAGGEDLRLIGGGWRARFLEMFTRALLATDSRGDAERAATAAKSCADAVKLPTASGFASMAAGAVALDNGDGTTASQLALAAAIAFESVGAAWDAARARQLAGRAFAQAGDQAGAIRELQIAAAAFGSFGSLRYRSQAERELRKLGRRIHHRTPGGARDAIGIEALTARELEVARLVVDRRTNPEIADELFLSQKTVETHLRNIFNKMDVADRVALARAVERADRTVSASPPQTPAARGR